MTYEPDFDYERADLVDLLGEKRIKNTQNNRCSDGYCGQEDCDICHPGWQFNSDGQED